MNYELFKRLMKARNFELQGNEGGAHHELKAARDEYRRLDDHSRQVADALLGERGREEILHDNPRLHHHPHVNSVASKILGDYDLPTHYD